MRRVAPNSFAIPFSVAGLGGTWLAAADAGWAPRPVGEALFLVAAVLWLAVLVAYGAQVAADPGTLRSDLVHPVS
jgi:tellurite resistance protein